MPMMQSIVLILQKTAWQLCFWGLPLLVLGFVMQQVAGGFQRAACRMIGVRGYMIFFGWLGSAVHELSHAAVAVLFRHKIDEIRLFRLSPNSGKVGCVRHRHDPDSLYQRAGGFFIAAAPLLIGALLIYAAAVLLAPEIVGDMAGSSGAGAVGVSPAGRIHGFVSAFLSVFERFFVWENFEQWEFYLLLYLLFAIGSAMRLSTADVKGAKTGVLIVLLAMIALNAVDAFLLAKPVIAPAIDGAFVFVYHIMLVVLVLHLVVFLPVLALDRLRAAS